MLNTTKKAKLVIDRFKNALRVRGPFFLARKILSENMGIGATWRYDIGRLIAYWYDRYRGAIDIGGG
jgi:hypothetical protein